jgi:hypothetical protein
LVGELFRRNLIDVKVLARDEQVHRYR